MNTPATQVDKVFLRPAFSIHYRRASRVRWQSEARADYSLALLLSGELSGHVNEFETDIRSGAILLEPGATASVAGREIEFLTITIAPSYVLDCAVRTRLFREHATITFRRNVIEHDERLALLAHNLADELSHEAAGQEIVIVALIEQLLVHLLRHHSNVRHAQELELSRVGLVDRRIRRAVELMHAHLDRELPLEEIAAAAYLSPFHFARLFKKLTGASPHAYLATLRIARAQSLLADTDSSVTEISARVGYSSSSHFTKAFRQATGLTPSAFRAALVSR
jgi:AraC family transcriptional regulator